MARDVYVCFGGKIATKGGHRRGSDVYRYKGGGERETVLGMGTRIETSRLPCSTDGTSVYIRIYKIILYIIRIQDLYSQFQSSVVIVNVLDNARRTHTLAEYTY